MDLKKNAASFTHIFERDTELTGPMALDVWLRCAGTNGPYIFVGVEKWSGGKYVPFEGSYGYGYGRDRFATGRLRVTLRDESRDDAPGASPGQAAAGGVPRIPGTGTPHPDHQFHTLRLLQEGGLVRARIPLSPSATRFRAGDTLRLLVAGRYLEPRNPLVGHFPTHYEPSCAGPLTLQWAQEKSCSLEIPVIP